MEKIFIFADKTFNSLEKQWKGHAAKKITGFILVITYIISLLIIELKRQDILPDFISGHIPSNHFNAIDIAFSLVLIIEIIDLVFCIAHSFSESMGKQLEIYSLILIRTSFKEFSFYHEPLRWKDIYDSVLPILSNAGGGLLIFIILAFYYRLMNSHPITKDVKEQFNFIASKKLVSLILLLSFALIGITDFKYYASKGDFFPFFDTFYTVLVFTDILILLISMKFTHVYMIVFRNSGFTLATILIRLALTAPHYYNIALGLVVSIFVLLLMISYDKFVQPVD